MATENPITTVHTTIPSNMMPEKKAVDIQRIICSHHDWVGSHPETSQSHNQILKEPDNPLLKKMKYMNSPTTLIENTVKHKWMFYIIYLVQKL